MLACSAFIVKEKVLDFHNVESFSLLEALFVLYLM